MRFRLYIFGFSPLHLQFITFVISKIFTYLKQKMFMSIKVKSVCAIFLFFFFAMLQEGLTNKL